MTIPPPVPGESPVMRPGSARSGMRTIPAGTEVLLGRSCWGVIMQPGYLADKILTTISRTPVWLYFIVAVILIAAALTSLYEAVILSVRMISAPEFALGKDVLIALFHAITAIVLLETTIVFFRTNHLAVQTLLIAGLTETIRHVLVYDVMTMESMHIFALVSV